MDITFPLIFKIGPFCILAHVVFEVLGIAIAFQFYIYLRKKQKDLISEPNRLWILIGAAFGALVFSRLIGSLENPAIFFSSKNTLLYFYSHKTILGALFGGVICVEIVKKIIGEKKSSGDLFVYPLLLGMIIGRIGCLSMGIHEQTYGIPSDLPWALYLGDEDHSILRHPVALYEMLFLGMLWISFAAIEKKVKFKEGIRFQFFLMAYFIFRLLIDFIKPGYKFSFGLSTIQITALLGMLYYSRTFYRLFFKPKTLIKEVEIDPTLNTNPSTPS
jgi:phosphatidylglycerol:prolipoprotein diacylglycerol transferase